MATENFKAATYNGERRCNNYINDGRIFDNAVDGVLSDFMKITQCYENVAQCIH
jgi:hypothetical protein